MTRNRSGADLRLGGEDLARLRTGALSAEQSDNPATSNVPQSTSSNTVNESGGATQPYEMERLRTSGLETGAPLSYYTGGDG